MQQHDPADAGVSSEDSASSDALIPHRAAIQEAAAWSCFSCQSQSWRSSKVILVDHASAMRDVGQDKIALTFATSENHDLERVRASDRW